mmetsp:Transcript_57274/g.125430  ORF Transcript_57274/g.125430 Transcript_57274/m.125430 type:complete len:201 (+) Transcript_57274:427-1029(+)
MSPRAAAMKHAPSSGRQLLPPVHLIRDTKSEGPLPDLEAPCLDEDDDGDEEEYEGAELGLLEASSASSHQASAQAGPRSSDSKAHMWGTPSPGSSAASEDAVMIDSIQVSKKAKTISKAAVKKQRVGVYRVGNSESTNATTVVSICAGCLPWATTSRGRGGACSSDVQHKRPPNSGSSSWILLSFPDCRSPVAESAEPGF